MQRLINDACTMDVIKDGRLIIGDIAINNIRRFKIFDVDFNRFFGNSKLIFSRNFDIRKMFRLYQRDDRLHFNEIGQNF